ncbi:hypothetical protein V6Z11_A11G273000 [Gossypium hirsutum]
MVGWLILLRSLSITALMTRFTKSSTKSAFAFKSQITLFSSLSELSADSSLAPMPISSFGILAKSAFTALTKPCIEQQSENK